MTTPAINETEPVPAAAPRSGFARLMLVLTFLAVGAFDFWTMESTGHRWNFGAEQRDYYNLLIDGWLDGQLNMKVAVPAEMLKLKNPYDPEERPPEVGLHDASYYRGKYYLYFGAAPLLVTMLPFRVVTGIDLPVAFATLAFVYAGFLASAAVWLAVRRRYFPETSTASTVLCVVALGLASLAPVLLRRPQMWELPIAAGYFFAMAALGCLWRCLHAERRGTLWLLGASLALGLAVASRPPYLFASPLLLAPLLLRWWRERTISWSGLLAVTLPMAAIGALMALHNALRFGSPFEFGQAYQLTYFDETKMPHFSLRYAGFNLWRYFFSRPQWSMYFPFISPAELPPKPPGFSGHDDLYGVLANLPLAWLALLAPLALVKRSGDERLRLGTWLAVVAGLFTVMAALLLCFFGSLARYEVDFTPALMLLACVGVVALERVVQRGPAVVEFFAVGLARAAGLAAFAFVVLFTLQYDGQLQHHNPATAARLARVMNWIPYTVERARGIQHGGVELQFTLRARPAGDETLLSVGDGPTVDHVLVRHTDAARVQFVVAAAGLPELASRPVPLDFTQPHRLRVVLGSLLPPATHPLFADRTEAELADLTRQVRLELDDRVLIDELRELTRGTGKIRLGREALAEETAPVVADVQQTRRVAASAPVRVAAFARLRLAFPPRAAVRREPLLGFRDAAGAGLLFVHYVDDAGQVAFGMADGERRNEGDAIGAEPGKTHDFVVRWLATSDPTRPLIEARLDGTIVFAGEAFWPPQAPLTMGRNNEIEPGFGRDFTGHIYSTQAAEDGRDPLTSGKDVINLRLRFPTEAKDAREPLLVTGSSGSGDLLLVEYVDEQTIRFGFDHWGGQLLLSDPVRVDFSKPHELSLATAALWGPADGTPLRMAQKGPVRVELDQRVVWEIATPCFASRPDEIAIGYNPIGGTSSRPRFTGDIYSAERVQR